jgi:hypothetical protein
LENIQWFRGPRTDPCGTPPLSCQLFDWVDSIAMRCVRSLRYDTIHEGSSPVIPYEYCIGRYSI